MVFSQVALVPAPQHTSGEEHSGPEPHLQLKTSQMLPVVPQSPDSQQSPLRQTPLQQIWPDPQSLLLEQPHSPLALQVVIPSGQQVGLPWASRQHTVLRQSGPVARKTGVYSHRSVASLHEPSWHVNSSHAPQLTGLPQVLITSPHFGAGVPTPHVWFFVGGVQQVSSAGRVSHT